MDRTRLNECVDSVGIGEDGEVCKTAPHSKIELAEILSKCTSWLQGDSSRLYQVVEPSLSADSPYNNKLIDGSYATSTSLISAG